MKDILSHNRVDMLQVVELYDWPGAVPRLSTAIFWEADFGGDHHEL